MVVLSACETGLGEVEGAEGVYGLRRAVLLAGAEAVVTSLWSVDNTTTREMMERFYGHLLEGAGRADAVHQVMAEMRQQRRHPYYWAGFILIGRQEPLRELDQMRAHATP
jgi:CHAT domain-containing protein